MSTESCACCEAAQDWQDEADFLTNDRDAWRDRAMRALTELASLREELAAARKREERLVEDHNAMLVKQAELERQRAGSLPDNARSRLIEATRRGRQDASDAFVDSNAQATIDVDEFVGDALLREVRTWLSPVVPAAAERCCDNGDFGQAHDCQKQPGAPLVDCPACGREVELDDDGLLYSHQRGSETHGNPICLWSLMRPTDRPAAVPVEPPAAYSSADMLRILPSHLREIAGDVTTHPEETRDALLHWADEIESWPAPAAPGVAPTASENESSCSCGQLRAPALCNLRCDYYQDLARKHQERLEEGECGVDYEHTPRPECSTECQECGDDLRPAPPTPEETKP